MPYQIPPSFLVPVIAVCGQLRLKCVSKLFENVEWLNSLLRHFKIQILLKINCCMAVISAFHVTQLSQISSLIFRNRIQGIALYQLHSSQALLNLRRGYFNDFPLHETFSFNWLVLSMQFCYKFPLAYNIESQLTGERIIIRRQKTVDTSLVLKTDHLKKRTGS